MPKNDAKVLCTLYQVNEDQSFFEVDISPARTPKKNVESLIFKDGKASPVVSLAPTLRGPSERWKVSWQRKDFPKALDSFKVRFARYIVFGNMYRPGWQGVAEEEQLEGQRKEIQYNAWLHRYQAKYNNRTPLQLLELGGPMEFPGHGFAWVGFERGHGEGTQLQYHPYFGEEKFDKDVRWYLERGTSLREAISLTLKQWDMIHRSILTAFAMALADRSIPSELSGVVDAISEAMGTAAEMPGMPDAGDLLTEVVMGRYSNTDAGREQRIQQLSKVRKLIRIKVLHHM